MRLADRQHVNQFIRTGVPEPRPTKDYADPEGISMMCSHCRRVIRRREPLIWDWVPELLMSGTMLARFGLCEFCAAYHYHVR